MKSYIIIFFTLFSISIFAQEKIDTVKIINNGTLNMEIDSSIYNVLKTREDSTCTYNTPTKSITEKRNTGRANDPCYGNAQINGYKIQIYYSKNRNEANKVKEEFNSIHPELSAQVTYFTPDYRVLVGDYTSKNSAASDIRKLKSKYNNAFSIPFKVLCRKAK
ncbi:SPOR domain-containing protein [Chishuiella sp.]|uniref:SPOR domain-containing protein n=1 Tax=Chishuiella sp. TaxID=1969467 RepID=UPI0028A9E98F|nr:SPOR domain-containing protein [Chishuiella sp.]